MPLETITVTIGAGSANPQTKTVQINVDPNTGSGSGTVTFTGAHSGLDAIQANATIAGSNYTSNVANIAWQATNGVVSLLPTTIQGFTNPGGGSSYNGIGAQLSGVLGPFNSVIINQPKANVPISGVASAEYLLQPPHLNQVTSTGTWASDYVLPYQSGFVTIFQGQLVVASAGVHTLYWLVDDVWGCYIGPNVNNASQQPTRTGGTWLINGGLQNAPATANLVLGTVPAWPLLGTRNGNSSSYPPTDYIWVNFPAPGVYPFLVWYLNKTSSQTYHQMTFATGQSTVPSGSWPAEFGTVIKPIAAQAQPAATTPAGNLQLGLANGNFFVVGDTATINVVVQNVTYATKSYIPLLEGTTGSLYLYNDPSSPTFSFPTYNGQAVDKTAAASAVFSLTGDNTSWQGRLSLSYQGPNFVLAYNGSTFDAHVDVTQLTIIDNDVAWYQSTNKTFDLFATTQSGGGLLDVIEIDYMSPCNHVAVSPLTYPADGAQHVFTVSLVDANGVAKPVSPQQQGSHNTGNSVSLAVAWSGGITTNSITPLLDARGWLTGWNVAATVPSSSVNVAATMNATITGQLTYLSGTQFVTQAMTYMNNVQVASITLAGSGLTPPVPYSFSAVPVTGTAPSYTVVGTITLTGTVYTKTNVNVSLQFYTRADGTTSSTAVGTVQTVPTSSSTGTVGGQTVFFKTFSTTVSSLAWPALADLGFVATDQNGLTCTYWDASTYTNGNGISGGGGGCPSVDMYLNEIMTVGAANIGDHVTALSDDMAEYTSLSDSLKEEMPILGMDWGEQPCYLLVTENGAELEVSLSTPVPFLEAILAKKDGCTDFTGMTYVSDAKVGMSVLTDVGNGLEWSKLAEVVPVGMKLVAHLFCGGHNFGAGRDGKKRIFTHNNLPAQVVK